MKPKIMKYNMSLRHKAYYSLKEPSFIMESVQGYFLAMHFQYLKQC